MSLFISPPQRLAVAPMLQWTDRHCRYLLRLLSRHTWLYTEMVTTSAILQGKRFDLLRYHPDEHPLALQLGGSDPNALAECARLAQDLGFDAVNLNVGCPSNRVQSGRFGACLFKEPDLVASCVKAMTQAVHIPITVKTRIGVDNLNNYAALYNFVDRVAFAGCQIFIIHAREAWLKGLSPKENREIPPLRYETVYQVKCDFPNLTVIINGGVHTIEEIQEHLRYVDGVMLGRSAYHNPMLLSNFDHCFFSQDSSRMTSSSIPSHTPYSVLEAYFSYIDYELKQGTRLSAMAKHLLPLFQGHSGARAWRRYLTVNIHKEGAGLEVLKEGLKCLQIS